jgi:integrase
MPKIWYRKSKKGYYLQIDRTHQRRLGATKAEAETAYNTWLLERGEQLPPLRQRKVTIAELAKEFLDHAKLHTKPKTYKFYCYFVVPFVERFGAVIASQFSPLAFTKWLDEHEGWKGSRRNAIISVKRLFNWAVENRLLSESPVKHVKRPPKRKRIRILGKDEHDLIYRNIKDAAFRDFVFALRQTGCRPGEIMIVTARHVAQDFSVWTFEEHKTAGSTGELRIVHLTPSMRELTRRLVERYPEGPIFRMYRGKKTAKDRYNRAVTGTKVPWTYNAIRCRFRRLRHKVPDLDGITSYAFRHTYATHALVSGVPVPVVAALLGNSLKMVDEHYDHTNQAIGTLAQAARTAANW